MYCFVHAPFVLTLKCSADKNLLSNADSNTFHATNTTFWYISTVSVHKHKANRWQLKGTRSVHIYPKAERSNLEEENLVLKTCPNSFQNKDKSSIKWVWSCFLHVLSELQFFIFKNEFFQTPLSVCKLMVSSLLSLLPVTKTVQFVAVITYDVYI